MADPAVTKPGRRYWLVAILALAWNGFGCLDFVLTGMRQADWLAALPPEVIVWLDTAPYWATAAWALGVGCGVLGALGLLARSRWALVAFVVSLAGLAANQAWQFTSDRPGSLASPGDFVLNAFLWIVALALVWHAARAWREGVLR